METLKLFIARMQEVRFVHDTVYYRRQDRREFYCTSEQFWGDVLPKFEVWVKSQKKEQAA